jgi:arylsulfatase
MSEQKKPNVIFILVDNVGWGDFGTYGGTIPTPNIDKLASEGIRFNDYNVEVQCTPTRSAIMTGRHPVRSGTYKIPMPGQGKAGMSPWEYTIADMLSDSGYATALFGKWHLGDSEGRLPNDQGFDEWWGIKNSWDEAGYTKWPLFKETGIPAPMIWEGKKGSKSTEVMPLDEEVRAVVDEKYLIPKTIDFIKKNAATGKPSFTYVGYSEMHPPFIPNPNYANKSTARSGAFADIIVEMDDRVGQIVDAVEEAGLDENTMIILSSDNGGGGCIPQVGPGSSGPWRGDFFNTPFEGSMRVPAIVRWPGSIPAGVVTEERFAAVDWLPTLAGIVGESDKVPADRPIDGVDASDFMLGKSEKTGRDSYMFFGPDGKLMSVKWKHYKTIFRFTEDLPAVQSGFVEPQLPMMYDLSSDPHEDSNLWWTELTNGWIMEPVIEIIDGYEKSAMEYPNIKVGQDFDGYEK